MEIREQADTLLSRLGDTLGLALALDADGACGLRLDDRLDLTLRLEPEQAALLVYSQVGALPAIQAEAVLRRLLSANHVWEGSGGATWSLLDGELVLARLLPLSLDSAQLEQALLRFVETACDEQDRLNSGNNGARPDRVGGLPPAGMLAV